MKVLHKQESIVPIYGIVKENTNVFINRWTRFFPGRLEMCIWCNLHMFTEWTWEKKWEKEYTLV